MAEKDLEDVRYWITEEGVRALQQYVPDSIMVKWCNSHPQFPLITADMEACGPSRCLCEDGWLP